MLNQARELTDKLIDETRDSSNEKKPRTYRKRARKDYLNITRCKKRSAKKIREAIRKQPNTQRCKSYCKLASAVATPRCKGKGKGCRLSSAKSSILVLLMGSQVWSTTLLTHTMSQQNYKKQLSVTNSVQAIIQSVFWQIRSIEIEII